jgi:hypothetical protein
MLHTHTSEAGLANNSEQNEQFKFSVIGKQLDPCMIDTKRGMVMPIPLVLVAPGV